MLYNAKGGAGKTTTSCNLAGSLALRGFDVLVADLDDQGSSTNWIGIGGGAENTPAIWPGHGYGAKVSVELGKLAQKYEIIVVDCAPGTEKDVNWAALMVADLVIVPSKLEPVDLGAVAHAKRLIEKAWDDSGRKYPGFILPVEAQLHKKEDLAYIEMLRKHGGSALGIVDMSVTSKNKSGKKETTEVPMTLGDRNAFTRPALIGATAHSIPNSKLAVSELELLTDFVLNALAMPSNKEEML